MSLELTESHQKFEKAFESILNVWTPPPDLTISEWADQYGVLTAESSAEPGTWRSYNYQKAMMDAFCSIQVEKVTVKKSARLGWTKILGHVIGYHIHQDPCSILVVQPTIDDAEGYSKEEVQPTIDETEVLRSRVGDSKSRTSGNTISKKTYPGGILHIIGANSPRGFRRITVRLVLFDEADGYPPTAGQEGDQIKLGTKRTETFWNRKIGLGSTPTNKGTSRVGQSFEKSDKGYFFLTCPHCDGQHIRLFREPENPILLRGNPVPVSIMHWVDDDPRTALWMCPDCSGLIDHGHHYSMVESGYWFGETWEWHADKGFVYHHNFTGHIGFALWAGYSHSPNSTPTKLVAEFLDCKDDSDLLKTFVNTVLGEEWEEKGEAANEYSLIERSEIFQAEVPDGAMVLTAGIDVQKDRLELEVVGWAEDQESWSVDYIVLPGDTTQHEVWDDLADTLNSTYEHESGAELKISSACIDSGYLARTVYDFVKKFNAMWVYPIKGVDGFGRPIVESTTRRARRLAKRKSKRIRPELIGVDEAKVVLMRRLKLSRPGPGYCHFPTDRDRSFFEQLTAEQMVVRYKKGRPVRQWMLKGQRNEATDCRVYAHAALLLANPHWQALKPSVPKPKKQSKDLDETETADNRFHRAPLRPRGRYR